MTAFSKRLLMLFAGIVGFGVCASALTTVVEYKPWGVPDSHRDEYESIVNKIDHHEAIRDYYADRARPIAKALQAGHDAGLQSPNASGTKRFEVRNEGLELLELSIGSVDATCSVEFESTEIAPGESGYFILTWNLGDEAGEFEKVVTVNTNDPLNQELQFKLVGRTQVELMVPETVSFRAADPAVQTDGEFVVYSELWEDFRIRDVDCDLPIFQWHAEPLTLDDRDLQGTAATSAWRVRIWTTAMDYGYFAGNLKLTTQSHDGTAQEHTISLQGRVRPPIIFHSPEIHMSDGLDMGTIHSGLEHQFHLVVRLRGDRNRAIEVLELQPKELRAELTPQSSRGNYRLTLTIPADCPMVVFNTRQQHGFVSVGDPNDSQFKNGFPIHGAVVPPQR
jgi:hypothetical protein